MPKGVGLSRRAFDQMRSLDWVQRRAQFHSKAPMDLVIEVLARIEAVLAIDLLRAR